MIKYFSDFYKIDFSTKYIQSTFLILLSINILYIYIIFEAWIVILIANTSILLLENVVTFFSLYEY